MKKLILIALAAAGIVVAKRKLDQSKAEQAAWSSVTDRSAGPDPPGALAQLVAHLLCKQGVRGSSPLRSTRETPGQPGVSFISRSGVPSVVRGYGGLVGDGSATGAGT